MSTTCSKCSKSIELKSGAKIHVGSVHKILSQLDYYVAKEVFCSSCAAKLDIKETVIVGEI